ncbi:MAG: hypothetical protein AAF363_21575 [Bacteroidota bacterium]
MKKTLSSLLITLALLSTSCGNDEEITILSPEEARASLERMESDLASDFSSISTSPGLIAISQILNFDIEGLLNQRSGSQGTSLKSHMEQLRNALSDRLANGRISEESCFGFEERVGIYEYELENDEFIRVSDSDFIILNFPTTDSSGNNASLSILRFNETSFQIFGDDEICLPSEIEIDLSIDGTTQLELDIRVSYNSQFFLNTFDMDLFLNPYSFQLSINNSSSQSVRLASSLSTENESILSTEITTNFTDHSKVEAASIDGFFQYRNIRFLGNLSGFSEFEENPNLDPNSLIDIQVFDGNLKMGDVVLVAEEDEDDEYYPFIQLSDGSLVSIEALFEMLLEGSEFFG